MSDNGSIPSNRLFGPRIAPAILGVGLIAAAPIAVNPAQPTAAHVKSSSTPLSADESQADAVKALTSGGGKIDGYLAGGRWREGSKLLDIAGQFKVSGDRVAFHAADGKSRFACLENLNSERVARIVAESPDSLDWTIQGTITEFRNENYLLLTQAVIKSRSTRTPHPAGGRPETPELRSIAPVQ
jgi:hypothetical protein